jgi:hypothetical protein
MFARRKDLHIIAFKSRNPNNEQRKEETILQFMRYPYDDYNKNSEASATNQNNELDDISIDLTAEFSLFNIFNIQEKSLTLMYDKKPANNSKTNSQNLAIVDIKPMEFKTFVVTLYPSLSQTISSNYENEGISNKMANLSEIETTNQNKFNIQRKGVCVIADDFRIFFGC